jgi:hypothetical protein
LTRFATDGAPVKFGIIYEIRRPLRFDGFPSKTLWQALAEGHW